LFEMERHHARKTIKEKDDMIAALKLQSEDASAEIDQLQHENRRLEQTHKPYAAAAKDALRQKESLR